MRFKINCYQPQYLHKKVFAAQKGDTCLDVRGDQVRVLEECEKHGLRIYVNTMSYKKNAFPAFMTPEDKAVKLIGSTHLSHDDGTTSVLQICSVVQIVHTAKILILTIYYVI